MSEENNNSEKDAEKNLKDLRERLQKIEEKALKKLEASKLKNTNEDKCSFCGKAKCKVSKLLQAESGATICDECVRKFINSKDAKYDD